MQRLLTKAAHSISFLSLHTSTHILTSFGSNLGFFLSPKDTLTCSHSHQPSNKWTSCSTMSKMDAFYVIGQVDLFGVNSDHCGYLFYYFGLFPQTKTGFVLVKQPVLSSERYELNTSEFSSTRNHWQLMTVTDLMLLQLISWQDNTWLILVFSLVFAISSECHGQHMTNWCHHRNTSLFHFNHIF